MANRFLNNITVNDSYTFPSTDGSNGQAIITDGAGNLTFGSATAASADSAESVHISVKNTSGAQILKGTPVYVTGETGNSGKIEIAPADASDSAKMPALGILESTLNDNAEGFCVQGGLLEGLATDTIDGTATTANDTVYVKAGGGLTMTKPTGSNLIQNIAKVVRVHASNGSLVVSSILRTNDVPNLPTGKIWVGDGNTTVSDVVYLDESNGRMGIGTTSPGAKLQIGSATYAPNANLGNNLLQIKSPSGFAYLTIGNGDVANSTSYIGGASGFTVLGSVTDAGVMSEHARITSSGSVGIGTTAPNSLLQVGEVLSSNKLTIGGYYSTGGGHLAYRSGHGSNSSVWDTAMISATDDGNYNGRIEFKTTTSGGNVGAVPTVKMVLKATGNVGIGTTNPASLLYVGAATNFAITGRTASVAGTADSETILTVTRSGLDYPQVLDFGVNQSGLYSTISARQFTVATENKLVLQPNGGNVGIGTTSPSHELVVQGASSPNIELKNSNYSTGGFVLNRTNYTQQWKWWAESSIMYFGYATDESTYSNVMSIQNNGNTNILGDLTVTGDGNFTGTELQGDNKTMLRYSDSWLRINDDNDFVSGIYCGTGILRTDGDLQVGDSGTKFLVTSAGAVTAESTLTLDNGQIVLNGTGRIQGVDTVSANTDAANRAYVDDKTWDWNDITTGTPPTFNQNTTGNAATATSLPSFDTRSTNPAPNTTSNGVRYDFKTNTTNGLSDGGTYNGQMTWRSYSNTTDLSGGMPMNIAYTANGNLWTRIGATATTWGTWYKLWSSGNDGAGSGLDADTVDGLQASQFLRSDTNDTFTGNLTTGADNHITFGPNTTWGSYLRVGGNGRTATGTEMASVVTTDGNLHLDAADAANAIYLNYYAGTNGVMFGNGADGIVARMDAVGNLYKATSTSNVTATYWHSGNDGSGSGLDADLLDGQHASAFQAAGTYNTIIGTDTDISYTGATVLSTMTMTDGVVESHSSRTLTLGDLGYTGATNANNYVHPTHPGDDINLDTGALTGATVISDLDFNITTDTLGHVTDANATYSTRNLTASDVGAAASSHTHPASDIVSGTLADARLSSNVFLDRGDIDVTTVTDGSNSNPFDDAHSETKIAENGMRTISYTGASAFLYTWNNGGSASVVQLGAHYNGDDFYMRVRTDGSNWRDWKKLWHNGNDGAGSGLDADLLDGQQGSYYASAASLGNYLPLAGGTMSGNLELAANTLNFADNGKLRFGNSTDLQIFHDGSNSYINESGAGRLILSGGSDIQLQSPVGELMADFNSNGSVDLYYDNSKKFETTSTGVTVTGIVEATGGNSTEWNTAYDNSITAATVTGTTTKTLTLTQQDGGTVTANWSDETGSGITGSGTTNYIPKFTGTTSLGNSSVYDNGTNVGIGTAFPGAKLSIGGVSGELLRLDDSSATGNPYMSFYQAGGRRSYIQHLDASDLLTFASEYGGIKFMTGTGGTEVEKMRILADGNVGINTTAPTEKLAVTGNIETTETANGVKIGFNVGDSFTLNGADTAHYGLSCGSSTSVPLVLSGYYGVAIATNGLERVRVINTGEVGIGVTNPAEKLEVVGNIKANKYINQRVAWNSTFSHTTGTGVWIYIPVAYITEQTADSYYLNWIAAYGGRVRKVVLRGAGTGPTQTATTTQFRVMVNGSTVYTTGTLTVTGTSPNKVVSYEFGDSDAVFSATDRVQVLFNSNGVWQNAAVGIIIEYTE